MNMSLFRRFGAIGSLARADRSIARSSCRNGRVRRLAMEALESRCLLSGISSVTPTSAAQGSSNLSLTINLSTSATPPVPPTNVAPSSATIGTIQGTSLTHVSQYVVTGLFNIPVSEAAGTKDVAVSFSTPNGTVTYSLAAGFTVTSVPEIQVLDGTTDIPDGTGSDSFGNTVVGTPISKTFTVKNLGGASLTLGTPITVPAGFTVTSSFGSTTVAAGGSTSFTVRMNASTAGSYSGTLSFSNNDSNENPFDFTISGTVTAAAAPDIQVLDGTTNVADGTGSDNFGTTTLGVPLSRTFTVRNPGTAALTLAGPISVPSGFTVTGSFGSTTLAAGASTTFTVRMDATAIGSCSGTVSFGDNVSGKNPFDFSISGVVAAPLAHPYTVVDTGQTQCYNATTAITAPSAGQAFYGQDGQIQGNPPSFTLSTDGLTVYDNTTGLTWQRSPDTNADGTINASDKFNWTNAQARPAVLNAQNYGGFNDWRLPTIKELYSLIDFRGTDPSGMTGNDTSGLTPFVDRTYFNFAYGDTSAGERVIDSQYASSNLYVGNTSMLFGVNFADGRIKGYGLTAAGGGDKTFFVQCVRGNTSYGVNNFTNNGDGTVSDNATGLMWSQADSSSGMNWQDALAWVQTKNAANYLGHNDWRLPNVKELQSILDYTRSPGTTSSAAINAVFSCTQITNEPGNADYPWYWTSTTHAAYNGSATTADYLCFGRGLGYMNSAWVDVHGAGSQRSDPKAGSLSSYTYAPYGYYNSVAPQGDAIRINNYVRLVRDLPTVFSAAATNWTSDSLTLKRVGSYLHLYQAGTLTDVVTPALFAKVNSIQIVGRDNTSDTLSIDFSGGNPIPAGGLSFNGGQGTGTNVLAIADAPGSDSFTMNAAQITVNRSTVVGFSNVQAFTLDLGTGSLDLGGATTTVGGITLVSGRITHGGLSSGSYAVQSGKIEANLAGTAALTKTGTATVILSGQNHYTGATAVQGGRLILAGSQAFPDGGSLIVAAGGKLVFDSSLATADTPASGALENVAVTAAPALAVVVETSQPAPEPTLPQMVSRPIVDAAIARQNEVKRQSFATTNPGWWAAAISFNGQQNSIRREERLAAVDLCMRMYIPGDTSATA